MNNKYLNIKLFAIILILGIVFFILNLFLGSVTIPFNELIQCLLHPNESDETFRVIIFEYRYPQAVTAMMAGAALAVSGLLMQTLFRNPLADPSILGISSGASLGVALVILLTGTLTGAALSTFPWWSTIGVSMAAFIGAIAVLLIILTMSNKLSNMTTLIIVGIMIAYIASSITDILKFFSQKEDIHAFVIWGMGSFSGVSNSKLLIFVICIAIGLFISYLLSNNLNVLLLGELYAENLGLNLRKNNIIIILVSGYLTAIVTAYCGPVAFIGLAVPHLARFLFKTNNHKVLLPATMLIGMTLTLFCNLIARLPGFEGNLPINAVTAFIGAPVVLWVIFKYKRN